ncbi:unnamed protein product [Lampetra fluviatilis]
MGLDRVGLAPSPEGGVEIPESCTPRRRGSGRIVAKRPLAGAGVATAAGPDWINAAMQKAPADGAERRGIRRNDVDPFPPRLLPATASPRARGAGELHLRGRSPPRVYAAANNACGHRPLLSCGLWPKFAGPRETTQSRGSLVSWPARRLLNPLLSLLESLPLPRGNSPPLPFPTTPPPLLSR